MANKNSNKNAKKLVNQLKKVNKKTLAFMVLFAIFGGALGFGSCYFFTKDDVFKINGETEIVLKLGDEYIEQGATAIAFGKDVSANVKIDASNLDLNYAGSYVVKYTIDNFRFKNYVLTKLVIVEDVEV